MVHVLNTTSGNLYAYGANNPVRYVDPDGNENVSPSASMGQMAHKYFFEIIENYNEYSKSNSLKIFDSTIYEVAQEIGGKMNPNRIPCRDEIPSPLRRPDVVNITYSETISVEVMELKPISCLAGYKHKKAENQLNTYQRILKLIYPNVNVSGGKLDEVCDIPYPFPIAGENATIMFIKDESTIGLYLYKIDDGEL